MGKIKNRFKEFNNEKINVFFLQLSILDIIDLIFYENEITNIDFDFQTGIGERGTYEGIENQLININFKYNDIYDFEFYLFYDQLEYYIINKSGIIGKCNLEDYTDDENEMIYTFIKYLKKDLSTLNIPFNEVN